MNYKEDQTLMIISTFEINQSLNQYEETKEKIIDILPICSRINERRYEKLLNDLLNEINLIIAILKKYNKNDLNNYLFRNAKIDLKINKCNK